MRASIGDSRVFLCFWDFTESLQVRGGEQSFRRTKSHPAVGGLGEAAGRQRALL